MASYFDTCLPARFAKVFSYQQLFFFLFFLPHFLSFSCNIQIFALTEATSAHVNIVSDRPPFDARLSTLYPVQRWLDELVPWD